MNASVHHVKYAVASSYLSTDGEKARRTDIADMTTVSHGWTAARTARVQATARAGRTAFGQAIIITESGCFGTSTCQMSKEQVRPNVSTSRKSMRTEQGDTIALISSRHINLLGELIPSHEAF